MKITIIGGGNLGTLMGAMFAAKGHEITIHTSKPDKFSKELEVYSEKEELLYKGIIARVTNNWKESIENAELIWVVVFLHFFFI